MVDYQRQLLDELMGRNRNLDPGQKVKEKSWKDSEHCKFYMHSFCPHDLFVNTRADLGPCAKTHDDEIKKLYEEAARCPRKLDIEREFLRFITQMISEVDRKIIKGKQRLDLMNSKLDTRPVSKQTEAVHSINDKISKLLRESEEAGTRGDVDQAQNLFALCEKLKEDKETLIKQYESCGFNYSETQEKQMEVCETCGAFLIIGDQQSRVDDHLMGKQHIGYTRLRKALEDHRKNADRDIVRRRSGSAGASGSSKDRRSDDRSRYRNDHHRRDDRDRGRNREHRRDRRRSRSKSRDRHRRRSRS